MLILSVIPESENQVIELMENYPHYWIEYRLDLFENWYYLKNKINGKTILTVRDPLESGGSKQSQSFDIDDKIEMYAQWQKEHDCFVDLELINWNEKSEKSLDKDKLIISSHNFGDWSKQDIATALKKMQDIGCKFAKIAVEVKKWTQLQDLEEIISNSSIPVLLAITGKFGESMRFLYKHIGAAATFIGINGNFTATGQPSLELAEKTLIYDIDENYRLCGIIGGRHVINSYGIEYYNKVFDDKGYHMKYLPFFVEDINDFLNWMEKTPINDKIVGFSITMPHKEAVAKIDGTSFDSVNLWNGKNHFANTDMQAIDFFINQEGIKEKSKVLILGSGGVAITAASYFVNFNAECFISARNFPKAFDIADKYELQYITPENINQIEFDLVINATPLGMNNENLLDFFNLDKFHAVIDLPYNCCQTPLQEYCKKENIKYISGLEFWKKQAAVQEKFFCENYLINNT